MRCEISSLYLITVHKFGIYLSTCAAAVAAFAFAVIVFFLDVCVCLSEFGRRKKASHGMATNENTRNILKDRNKAQKK